MGWIDISRPLIEGMEQWPGDPPYRFERVVDGGISLTTVTLCAHTGTHVDAPLHYLVNERSADQLPLDAMIGPARVTGIEDWEPAARLLLRTHPGRREWTAAEATRAAGIGVRLAGIDSLSIGDADVHRILLAAGVVILEGLQLDGVEAGEYDLICLPLKIGGADGAPARAVIRPRA